MVLLKHFLKYTKIRYIAFPLVKLSTSIAFCHSFERKRKSQKVYLFGSSLSLPEGSFSHPLFEGDHSWKCVGFGPSFGVAVDESNQVYLWGNTKAGEDTRGLNENVYGPLDYVKPFLLCRLSGIVDCQCSNNEVFFLKKNGNVCVVRGVDLVLSGKRDPKVEVVGGFSNNVLFNHPKIVKMSIGQNHSAFVSDDGSLCKPTILSLDCSGNNEFGQCGTKPSEVKRDTTFIVYGPVEEKKDETIDLKKVKFKENVKVKDVVCGLTHTVCVDSENNIYTFGDDSSIQLFFGDSRGRSLIQHRYYKEYFIPNDNVELCLVEYGHDERHIQYVPVKANDHIFLNKFKEHIKNSTINIAGGDGFTIISLMPKEGRTGEDLILSSGENKIGQCGSMDPITHAARKVKIPDRSKCKFITCGATHCMALTGGNRVWAWGGNSENQIDLNKKSNFITPERVKLTHRQEGSGEPKVHYVKCAYNNSVIITD